MSGFQFHRNQNPSNRPPPSVGHFDGGSFRPPFSQEFRPSVPQNQHAENQHRQQYQSLVQGSSRPHNAQERRPFVGDFRPPQQQIMDSYNHTGQIRPNYYGAIGPPESIPSTPRLQEHNPDNQKQGNWDRDNPTAAFQKRNMDSTRNFSTRNESVNNFNRDNNAATRNRFQNFSNETQISFPGGSSSRQPFAPNVMPPTFHIKRPVNIPYQNIPQRHLRPPPIQQQNYQGMNQNYGIPARLPWTPDHHNSQFSSFPVTQSAAVSEGFLQRQKRREEAEMDRNFIEDWLAKRKIGKERAIGKPNSLKLKAFHQELSIYLKCINELTMCRDVLLHFIDTDDQNWKEVLEKTLSIKVNLETIQERLFSNEYLDEIIQKVQQRKKKRARQKRLGERKAKEKEERNRNAIIADQKIDEWRHKIVSEINAKKTVDSLKSEAGQSLTEVRKKISDSTKHLEKFETIKELRGIRRQTALQRGIFIFGDQDQKFEQRIEKGKELLKERLEIYKDEEKTLRVMLEEEKEQLQKEDESKRRKIMEKEHMRIFGYNPLLESRRYWLQAEENPISLVQIRRLWDVYIVPGTIPGASLVPDGWVMPGPGKNPTWNKYLRKSKIAG